MPKEGARAAHHAPKIDIHQPRHLRLIEFVELAQQRDTRIVEQQIERRKVGDRGGSEVLNLLGAADIDSANRDATRMRRGNFPCHGLKTRRVQVGERQIAPAGS